VLDDGTPDKAKGKAKSKPVISDTSSYSASDHQSSDESDDMDVDLFLSEEFKDAPHIINGISVHRYNETLRGTLMETEECGLCGQVHGPSGECFMTDKSEFLAEYREMLIKYANEEPWEERVSNHTVSKFRKLMIIQSAAIKAIDETLHKRGHLGLIAGQPLHPLPTAPMAGASTPAPRAGNARNEEVQSAGSLKRPGSSAEEKAKKKPKPIPTSSCPICNRSPHHLVKDCPIVAAGPQRYVCR
jgi:chromodomain-helicase-DNA-binding protein 4